MLGVCLCFCSSGNGKGKGEGYFRNIDSERGWWKVDGRTSAETRGTFLLFCVTWYNL